MKLAIEQIKNITEGAVRVEEEREGVKFYRFSKEQEELYKVTNQDFYQKTFASAGVKLLFKTDSKTLLLKADMIRASSRQYFAFDVFVNGKRTDSLNNFDGVEIPPAFATLQLPHTGEFSKKFCLGEGEKTICVYFPWSAQPVLKEISIDDGSALAPVKHAKKLIAFGDSITHGYDALHPSNRYASKLADALDAEEINKGIGGECFFPELAALKESILPDYITVAYGTNDWNKIDEETFSTKCKAFYKNLSENYPDSKIFAITPIWRKDYTAEKKFGTFENVDKNIKKLTENLENVVVIRGFDFVPKDEKYFSDLRLHPNDEGFDYYYKGLLAEIKKLM